MLFFNSFSMSCNNKYPICRIKKEHWDKEKKKMGQEIKKRSIKESAIISWHYDLERHNYIPFQDPVTTCRQGSTKLK